MFVSLIRPSASSSNVASFKNLMMGLNVLLMLVTAVIAASTWTIRETVNRRNRRNRNRVGESEKHFLKSLLTISFSVFDFSN